MVNIQQNTMKNYFWFYVISYAPEINEH